MKANVFVNRSIQETTTGHLCSQKKKLNARKLYLDKKYSQILSLGLESSSSKEKETIFFVFINLFCFGSIIEIVSSRFRIEI